ncbi:uncharacterized protein LTR77_007445 [Saxophila tyrrhenica]|uniref:YjgF-like protein n=1 Tax=Saxophila tyrrhenica TaxID=1690608 RepID=A0AAV9P4S9_9PEZI|nr:hypothetical protein LTR77_007445 [Saxophila tyrrhenica]
MSTLTYTNPTGRGADLASQFHYHQAVRLPTQPPTLKLAGQGGFNKSDGVIPQPTSSDEIFKQVDFAFANVDDVLRTAGSKNGWGDVYLVRAYMVGMQDFDGAVIMAVKEGLRKWCGEGNRPVLTAVEVKGLALEGMVIEVEVEALMQ